MKKTTAHDQAKVIAAMMPALMRQLFSGTDDSAANLPLAQLRVCGVLEAGPRTMSALSRELGVSLSAITQIADRLERARLVGRIQAGKDRRVRSLQLTPQGERMMRLRTNARVRRIALVMRRLGVKDRKDILTALEKLELASRRSPEIKKQQTARPRRLAVRRR